MPDLTLETFWHCETDREWSSTVDGSKGRRYKVTWDRHSHRNHEVQYDYSCECEGYKFRKDCKHIQHVKDNNLRCGWNSFVEHDEPVKKDGEFFCPRCGEPAFPLQYAV